MSVTVDPTCALIERPRPAPLDTAMPHHAAVLERVANVSAALTALLQSGALISWVHMTPDTVRIRLHRAPSRSIELEARAATWRPCHEPDMAVISLDWRGVRVEWRVPYRPTDNPEEMPR